MMTAPESPFLDEETSIGQSDETVERWQALTPNSPYVWSEVRQSEDDDTRDDDDVVGTQFLPDPAREAHDEREPEEFDFAESFDLFEQEEGPAHTFKDCSLAQRNLLVASVDRARNALAVAEAHVAGAFSRPDKMPRTVRRLLLEHFHTTEKRHLREILANLLQLRMQFEKGIRFECEASCTKAQGYARTGQWFGGSGPIHICFGGDFNFADPTVTDEHRVILLIHEAAHRYRGITGNVDYHAEPAAYAKLTAKQAINNADSYAVFAAQIHAAPKPVREAEFDEALLDEEPKLLEAEFDRFRGDLEADEYESDEGFERDDEADVDGDRGQGGHDGIGGQLVPDLAEVHAEWEPEGTELEEWFNTVAEEEKGQEEDGPSTIGEVPLGSLKVEKEMRLASFRKLIASTNVVKVFARFEGKAKFSVQTKAGEEAKVELKLSKDAELKINDLFFGAHGAVSASGGKLQFKLGIEEFEVAFNPSLTNPISLHVPGIKLPIAGRSFKLEQELPSLGLKGTAEIEVEFVIDVMPNYRNLAKTLKPSNVRAAIQLKKNQLFKMVRKTKAVGRAAVKAGQVVVKAGRAAIYAPFKWLGNKIGRTLAIDSMKLGSQTAALRKLLGKAGKFLGAAGIALETWLLVQEAIPGLLARQHKRVIDIINLKFADGYSAVLGLYTDAKAPLTDRFFEWSTKIERIAPRPPDMFNVISELSRTQQAKPPKNSVPAWRDNVLAKGATYRSESMPMSEWDWQDLYREAYNVYFLIEDVARNSSNAARRKVAGDIIAKAYKMVEAAGMIAAHQDILGFVLATSVYEDLQGKQPSDVWEEWQNVAEFHRAMFGRDVNRRIEQYMSLIDPGSLRVSIPPFTDYSDWAN